VLVVEKQRSAKTTVVFNNQRKIGDTEAFSPEMDLQTAFALRYPRYFCYMFPLKKYLLKGNLKHSLR